MELTIQTTFDSADALTISVEGIHISLIASNGEGQKELILSAFEAQTIAGALLQMAAKLAPSKYVDSYTDDEGAMVLDDNYAEQMQAVEEYRTAKRREMTLNERIEIITDAGGGIHKRLKMQGGKEILVTEEVWEKEKHLQSECDNANRSFMTIRMDDEGNWYLVDTLPF